MQPNDLFSTPDPRVAQAQVCWAEAVILLKESGMAELQARRFFGKLLAQAKTHPADFLPVVLAAKAAGTMDAGPYLAKAAQRRSLAATDGALACTWG